MESSGAPRICSTSSFLPSKGKFLVFANSKSDERGRTIVHGGGKSVTYTHARGSTLASVQPKGRASPQGPRTRKSPNKLGAVVEEGRDYRAITRPTSVQTAKKKSEHQKKRGDGSEMVRLNKALASLGVASRRGSDEIISAGRISVNGKVVNAPGISVNMLRDEIKFDGRVLTKTAATNKYYFALNKPKGYICSNKSEIDSGSGNRLVLDLFSDWIKEWKVKHSKASCAPRLFTVGRLDVQSIGLIFVTNDGDWANAVQHPSAGLTKEYNVTLNRRPKKLDIERMSQGYVENGANIVPVAIALDDSDPSRPNRIKIIVSEGRNREVRNIVEAAGMEVKLLKRVRVGGYRIPRNLGFGQFKELRSYEIRRVTNIGADRAM
eukprot:jgi/Picsp_1/5734/NSC_03093-R1_protein